MVSNNLKEEEVDTEAWVGKLPDSVVDYLRGNLGSPPGGFPEPLRTHALAAKNMAPVEGRPGASLPDWDFDEAFNELTAKHARPRRKLLRRRSRGGAASGLDGRSAS